MLKAFSKEPSQCENKYGDMSSSVKKSMSDCLFKHTHVKEDPEEDSETNNDLFLMLRSED